MKIKVHYIEDEPFLGKIVGETLQQQGLELVHTTDGAKVINAFRKFSPDICVLDIMLPNIDGYSLCREIRALNPTIPIIFLTALTETADLVKGFESGGTDYIRKPFSMEELIIRIHNQLNLIHARQNEKPGDIGLGKYRFSPGRYELASPTTVHKLSSREMDIVRIFTQNINKVVERRDLLMNIWGDDSFFNSRTLDVYIRKIRSIFLEDTNIELVTLKGRGYLFMVRT